MYQAYHSPKTNTEFSLVHLEHSQDRLQVGLQLYVLVILHKVTSHIQYIFRLE